MPKTLANDLLASLVAFLVALPLCMGIAVASGAPAAAGIVAGIIGGLVVGAIGGSPLQVSGPAAGLAVIIWQIVQTHGIAGMGALVLLAGVIQMVAGGLKLGRWFQAVPPSVIYGMLAGIGVLIFASQFHVMVDDKPKGSGLANLVSIPAAIWKGVIPHPDLPHDNAAQLGAATIVTIVIWSFVVMKKWPKLKVVPAPLVGIVVATVAADVLDSPVAYVSLPDSLIKTATFISAPSLRSLLDWNMVGAAAGLAVVASAETLLCASATDRMHSGARTNYDRELFGQGVGNAICGAVGALPITGVIVRSSANVEAGAKTRLSAMLHGVWLLAAVVAIPFALRRVPVSALAALLVFTGLKLVAQDIKTLRERGGRFELVVFFVTILGIVATDLLKGVAFGLALSIGKIVWMFTYLKIDVHRDEDKKRTIMNVHGSATFLRLPELTTALANIPQGHEVHLHFIGMNYVDHAAFDALATFEKQHIARGGTVYMNWDEIEFLSKRPSSRAASSPNLRAAAQAEPPREDAG